MRITEEQRAILDSLVCERLSRNSSNMRCVRLILFSTQRMRNWLKDF